MIVSASQLIDAGQWDKFCELRGWSPWIVNEGLLSSSEDLQLTEAETAALMGVSE